ncbi:WEE protein kinase [Salpingoeca rosetta]|uniref:WEE protein kinase n=1 Tax=Salpingoeca rosetta (strain ATCC 50818 / BSB-021) TaxID=946362 RepID=F2UCY5_SALR5|nr:WEE protein kinase [Salpingoeca rosetta]EGD74480.1 WEE protein kinase [Salpingoeca rosetta]|eukprot:XP_004992737.1 WEE protein kinase [Salpingoeca rosetta]
MAEPNFNNCTHEGVPSSPQGGGRLSFSQGSHAITSTPAITSTATTTATTTTAPSPPPTSSAVTTVDVGVDAEEPRTPPALLLSRDFGGDDLNSSSFLEFSEGMHTPPRDSARRRRPMPVPRSPNPPRPRPVLGFDDTASSPPPPPTTTMTFSMAHVPASPCPPRTEVPPSPARKGPRAAFAMRSPRPRPNLCAPSMAIPPTTPTAAAMRVCATSPDHIDTAFSGRQHLHPRDATARGVGNTALLSLGTAGTFAATPHSPIPLSKQDSHIQLRNQPATPRSLLHRARRGVLMRNNSVVLASEGDDQNTNHANVNPFTPRTKGKRGHDDSQPLLRNNPQPHKKTFSVVRRYREEFVEESILGKGDFGTVYKCRHKLDGMVYAIKKSRKRIAGLAEERQLLREVYAHAVLQAQPYIVRYFSAWEEDNRMIIQNEYCDGGTLAKLFDDHRRANRPFLEHTLLVILKHLALGTHALHRLKLVHMDIKPANILIKYEEPIGRVAKPRQAARARRKLDKRMSMTADDAAVQPGYESTDVELTDEEDADNTTNSHDGDEEERRGRGLSRGTRSRSRSRLRGWHQDDEQTATMEGARGKDDGAHEHDEHSSGSNSFNTSGTLPSDLESVFGESGSDGEGGGSVSGTMSRLGVSTINNAKGDANTDAISTNSNIGATATATANATVTDTAAAKKQGRRGRLQLFGGGNDDSSRAAGTHSDAFASACSAGKTATATMMARRPLMPREHADNTITNSTNSSGLGVITSTSTVGSADDVFEPESATVTTCGTSDAGDAGDAVDVADIIVDAEHTHAHAQEAHVAGSGVLKKVSFKLGDLGLVTRRDDKSAEEGDSRYLAREVLKGQYRDLSKADVFSIGCTMYELASLVPLAANGPEWHRLRDSPPPLAGYSSKFNHLVMAMLSEQPGERPTTSDILKSELLRPDPDPDTSTQLKEALDRVQQLERELRQQKQLASRRGKVPVTRKQSCVF